MNNLKKIYFILDNIYNPDVVNGIFLRYKEFIENLLQEHITVILYTRKVDNIVYPTTPYFIVKFIKFIQVPFYKDLYIPVKINLSEIIPQNEILITLLEYPTLYLPLIKIQNSIKLIYGYHTRLDKYVNNFIKKSIYLFSTKLFYLLKPDLIFISGYSSKPILKKFFKCKIIVWDNVSKIYLKYPIIQNIYDTNQPINFIYTGRISIEKNLDMLFEIFLSFHNKNKNINLIIIGNGPQLEKYKTTYQNNNIIFKGLIKNDALYEEYQKYKNPLFIFPSTSETLGKSSIEASLCGLPVFTNISDETKYIYKDGINGFIFTSVNECIEKINKFIYLFSNEEKRNIIENGKKINKLFNKDYKWALDKINKYVL